MNGATLTIMALILSTVLIRHKRTMHTLRGLPPITAATTSTGILAPMTVATRLGPVLPASQQQKTVCKPPNWPPTNCWTPSVTCVSGLPGSTAVQALTLHHGVADLASNESAIRAAIDGLSPSNWTPLAEALHDIGRYFTGFAGTTNPGNQESACTVNGQYDGLLTLHPKGAALPKDDDTVFHDVPLLSSGVSGASPICHWCQKNFVVLLTDGKTLL